MFEPSDLERKLAKGALVMLVLFALAFVWMRHSGATWAAESLYQSCAQKHNFAPGDVGGYIRPKLLTLEEKQRLVDCAVAAKNDSFAEWVHKRLAPDIRKGQLRSPVDHAEPDSTMAMSGATLLYTLGIVVAFFMAIGLLIGMLNSQLRSGEDFSFGPGIAMVVGIVCLFLVGYGVATPSGRGQFDEMGGITLAAAQLIGLFAIGFGWIWWLGGRNRRRDD